MNEAIIIFSLALILFLIFIIGLFIAVCFSIVSIDHTFKDFFDLEFKKYQEEHGTNSVSSEPRPDRQE